MARPIRAVVELFPAMSTDRESSSSHAVRKGGRRIFAVLALLLFALMAIEWGRMSWRTSRQVTGEARWIWADVPTRYTPPQAFYAVRDFELEEVPESAVIAVLGDEEYILFLNGWAVGANRYVSGAGLDRYEIASFLRRGRNRLVAHLRSGSGNGAFLAALWLGEGEGPWLVTDADWRISHHRGPALMDREAEVEWPHRAVVVAEPPAGRWGPTSSGVARPLLRNLVAGGKRVAARRVRLPGERWSESDRREQLKDAGLGEEVLFDFGRLQSGFLTLRFAAGDPVVAVVYLGVRYPVPAERPPEVTVITSRGEEVWTDVVPRSFRYALVVGLDRVTDAVLIRSNLERLPPIVAGDPVKGVFGLKAPRLRTPAENVVWSELERFSGDTER